MKKPFNIIAALCLLATQFKLVSEGESDV